MAVSINGNNLKKRYYYNGTNLQPVKEKLYFNGTDYTSVWKAERDLLKEKWEKRIPRDSVGVFTFPPPFAECLINKNQPGEWMCLYKLIDFTDVNSVLYSVLSTRDYTISRLMISDNPFTGLPQYIVATSDTPNETDKNLDTRNITGEHYLALHMYSGSVGSAKIKLTKCILK